jgi:hypothetical protein
MTLRYVGGPLDGTLYPLEKDQPVPTEIRHHGWRGHYALQVPDPKSLTQFAPHLLWRVK